jgi:hypothetical protein
MQPPASASVRIGVFAILALGSLALKAIAGPPRDILVDKDPARFEQTVVGILRSQDFSTTRRTYPYRSTLVLAARGDCRIAVRDAKWGSGVAAVFAQDARMIGPVYYLYRGHRYSRPPGLSVRFGRLEYEILERVGMHRPMHLLVAFAASPSCGDSQFGLADVRVGA